MHAPDYASENRAALGQDWPRIPLPVSREELLASAALGQQVAALLDPESLVPEVTTGRLRPEVRSVGRLTVTGSTSFNAGGGDGEVNVRWGIVGNKGITMPSHGRVKVRDFTPEERAAIQDAGVALLGADTCDVWINAKVYWKNVPSKVWAYQLGGYHEVLRI